MLKQQVIRNTCSIIAAAAIVVVAASLLVVGRIDDGPFQPCEQAFGGLGEREFGEQCYQWYLVVTGTRNGGVR